MEKKFIKGLFYKDGKAIEKGPSWGMSLKAAGSMRFRWNEYNQNRINFFNSIADIKNVVQVELIHSKKVYAVENPESVRNLNGDGIITINRTLVPAVTVADCMPIYLYDSVRQVFGMLHSGWKGTGIVGEAIKLASEVYGSRPEDFSVVMGPHIHSCCYKINEERAEYFRKNFTSQCVTDDLHLSLAEANLSVLRNIGVKDNNVVVCTDCTCCNEAFGSFRRETSGLPSEMPLEEKQKHFTVQTAWVKW